MWKVGQRVFGQKGTEQFWYTGTVRHIDGERCYVIFDDGDDALLDAAQIKALDLHAGDRIFARLPMEAEFKPAKVIAWDDDKVQVQWTSGEENWTSFGMIRLQPEASEPQRAARAGLERGDRVFACWHDLFWYPAVVLARPWRPASRLVRPRQPGHAHGVDRIKPLALDAGDRVFCRRQGGPRVSCPARSPSGTARLFRVRYDDGDEEIDIASARAPGSATSGFPRANWPTSTKATAFSAAGSICTGIRAWCCRSTANGFTCCSTTATRPF